VFAVANAIPHGCPHVRVAALKWVYAQGKDKIRNGFIEALPLRVGRAIAGPSMKPVAAVAEVALRFFHVQCATAVSQLTVHAKVKLLGHIDTAVFGVLEKMCNETVETTVRDQTPLNTCIAMCLAWMQVRDKLIIPALPEELAHISAVAVPSIQAARPAAPPSVKQPLAPKVIEYRDGVAVSQQDVRVTGKMTERYAFAEFMRTSDVLEPIQFESIRSAVVTAVWQATNAIGVDTVLGALSMEKSGEPSCVRVLAARELPKDSFAITPLIQSASRVSKTASQGGAPVVTVKVSGREFRLFLTTNSSLPPRKVVPAASSVAEFHRQSDIAVAVGPLFSDHEWKSSHFAWPYWVIRRVPPGSEEANCKVSVVTVRLVHTFQVSDDPIVSTLEIELPVIVNTKDLKAKDELIVDSAVSRPAQPKAKQAFRTTTWESDLKRQKLGQK
jgi:hypothetical protein